MMVPGPVGPGPLNRRHPGPGGAAINAMGQIDTNVAPHQSPAEDLLGFDAPHEQPQLQEQHQVINANHATVSITTTAGAAPEIVGLGKIAPSTQNENGGQTNKAKRKVIYVPTYSCNGGLDTKFNHCARQARPSHLHNLLTSEEYEREIRTLNDKIKKAREKKFDIACLVTGPLLVPLAVWAARHSRQVKRKRKLIEEGVWEFNERMDGRNVKMFWNRHNPTGESYLTIEEAEADGNETEGGWINSRGGKKVD